MIQSIYLFAILFLAGSCTPKPQSVSPNVTTFIDANIPHLDPIHSVNKYSSTINASIFEGLYHYHYLKEPLTLRPLLAEGMPQVSKDRKTYTIKIKKGVYFQDDPAFKNGQGRELIAQDFIHSWKRLANPKNKALGWWVFDGLIEGLNEWRNHMRSGQASLATSIPGLQTPDNYTLVIKLTRPSLQFVHFLAMPVAMVTAKEVVKEYGSEITNHPVGTGPYSLKKWVRNSQVVLEKNEKYRQSYYPQVGDAEVKARGLLTDAGASLPLSPTVVVKILRERQPEWLSFLKGEIDHGIVPKENYDQVFENEALRPEFSKKGVDYLKLFRPDVTFVSFNMEDPLLGKNVHLRRAFALAINKPLILKKLYPNSGVMAHGPVPPSIEGHDPSYQSPLAYDPTRAREELVKAGFPEGKGLPVFNYELSNIGTWARQYGEFLKDQWAQVGIQVKLVANTWPQFDKKIKNKQASLFDMAWSADYPDAENFLQLFYSKNVSPGSNSSNFINRHYDELYDKMLVLRPGEKRSTLIRKMIDLINSEVPSIFIVHRTSRLPFHGWLKNYNERTMVYDYYKYLKIDHEKKKDLIKKL